MRKTKCYTIKSSSLMFFLHNCLWKSTQLLSQMQKFNVCYSSEKKLMRRFSLKDILEWKRLNILGVKNIVVSKWKRFQRFLWRKRLENTGDELFFLECYLLEFLFLWKRLGVKKAEQFFSEKRLLERCFEWKRLDIFRLKQPEHFRSKFFFFFLD